MKYEITKGGEKDFEFCDDDVLTKYRIIGHDIVTHSTHSSKKLKSCSLGHVVGVIAERRPVTDPVWDGEGLPLVGAKCEFKLSTGEWEEVEITAIARNGLCFVEQGKSGENYVSFSREFRPIRSPEDVARDEAALDLFLTINFNDTEADWVSLGERRNDYYKSIDAGYRKTPTVSELMRVTEKATREDCEAIVKMMGGRSSGSVVTVDDMWRAFEKSSDMEDVHKLIYVNKGRP